jgi:hypothetical protein
LRHAREKLGLNRIDVSGYHGRLNESNPKMCIRDHYQERVTC